MAPIVLEAPHVGRTGRAQRPADAGEIVRDPSRAITDPARRVFATRARYRSALVVVDWSGSMRLTRRDLERVLDVSRGSTVVAYSASDDQHRTGEPNLYVLAHAMRRADSLPRPCGGNGCDGPALDFAARHFRRAACPVLWITDAKVTGVGDTMTRALTLDAARRAQRLGVTCLENMTEALEVLEALNHGKRPAPRLHPRLAQALEDDHAH